MKIYRSFLLVLICTFSLSAFGKNLIVADAGMDQTVSQGDMVSLNGEAILKKKGIKKTKVISYNWAQTTGTQVDLADANTAAATFIAPQPNSTEEVLQFELTITATLGECRKHHKRWKRSRKHKRGHDDEKHCRTVAATDSVNITVVGDVIPTTAQITGHVTDIVGNPVIADIAVFRDASALQSDASNSMGDFDLQLSDSTEYVLKFTAPGYAVQSVPVKSPTADKSLFLEVTMIARGETQIFDSASSVTLTGADGATVSLNPGSFFDANGNVVTGDIQATITPVDVSHPAMLSAFPGEFSGVLEGDSIDTPIVSLGTVEYVFTQNDQPIQLGAGQTAAIEIPIYFSTYQDGSAINIGDLIPLWSLNADTGIWTQEGTGTVVASPDSPTGMAMSATTSHFTWWNCDVSMNAAQAVVTVYGADSGTAVIKAYTAADIGWRPSTVETVADIGIPTSPLYIPSNGEVCLWAEISYTNGSSATTLQECVTAAPNSLIYVDLFAPVAGPLTITTIPVGTAGVLDVTGYINYPITPVKLRPTTMESSVSYSIVSGALPNGVTLTSIDATRSQLAGIPLESGNFSVVIEGIDVDGNTDTVAVNFTVINDVPPPALDGLIQISNGIGVYNLSDYNNGGIATSWALSYNPLWEQGPPPASVTFNTTTGVLTLSEDCTWWQGKVIATNSNGSSEANIDIFNPNCY